MSRPLHSPGVRGAEEDTPSPPHGEAGPPKAPGAESSRSGVWRWSRRLAVALFVGYTAGLCGVWAGFDLIGEGWWLTAALLYLPRIGFALPLPFIAIALALFGPRRLLPALVVPIGIWLFPLMGLSLGLGAYGAATSEASFSLLTYNVAAAHDRTGVTAVIAGARPDVVVIQEYSPRLQDGLEKALPGFHRHVHGQLAVWSRFPIEDVYLPHPLRIPGFPPRSARFLRYRLDTPAGKVDLFNVHPVSPRNGLRGAKGDGFFVDLLRGEEGRARGLAALTDNNEIRRHQVRAVAREVEGSSLPVIVAGDTNLPGRSRLLGHLLHALHDAFATAGRGFGYTFPARRPWMRIDRILVDDRLAVTRTEVRGDTSSDHLAVRAVVSRRPGQDDAEKSKK